jgi:3-oxoacyl-[acyl-carrier protein] reductase
MSSRRTILITGTSRGLGRALAEHYVIRGHLVIGCSRSASDLTHERFRHHLVDIADESAVKKMFRALADAGTPAEVLINNAGLSLSRLAILTTGLEAERLLQTNLKGTFIMMREAASQMKRNRFGRIVNFSSINVPLGSVGSAVYSASKAAVEHLALTFSREFSRDNITVNTLGLSLVAGDGMAAELSEDAAKAKQSQLIKPKPISIDEIAAAIDFFASDNAWQITNQVVYFGGVR